MRLRLDLLGVLAAFASHAWRAGFSFRKPAKRAAEIPTKRKRDRAYTHNDWRARRNRIAKWRAKKKAGNLERNRQRAMRKAFLIRNGCAAACHSLQRMISLKSKRQGDT